MTMSNTGQLLRGAARDEYATLDHIVRMILNKSWTSTLVQVKAVRNDGAGPTGSVDIQPMVHQLTGDGVAVPHATIFNVPYFRLQGGSCAIIIDPSPGDIGIGLFAQSDISAVKKTRAPAPPGSRARFSAGDALYIGGFLNITPETYLQLVAGTATLVAPTAFNIVSPLVTLSQDMHVAGDITTAAGSTFNGKSFDSHTHGGVTAGSGTSGPPS